MKVTAVETRAIDRFLFVLVHTDAGITGVGESGAWGHLEASEAALRKFGEYLTGQDPLRIEHHWQVMQRAGRFRGAAIMGAISAIDVALWDIKGKSLGVPVYELLGGPTRDKVRVYVHVKAPTLEAQVEKCLAAKAKGYTAVGHLNPFQDERRDQPYFKTHVAKIEGAIESVRRFREAVGAEVDLCLEIHRRLTPPEAIVLGRGIESYHPLFYEDPVPPDNFDAMAQVAQAISIPIASGERLLNLQEFEMLLTRGAAQYLRPSPCVCGGITGTKKIAALAEARHLSIVPHNPESESPLATAVCLQIAASIPNLAIQEYSGNEDEPPASGIVRTTVRVENGFLTIPEGPGLGVDLVEDAREKFPPRPLAVQVRLNVDGSPIDQ